jgi:hypothetical protein
VANTLEPGDVRVGHVLEDYEQSDLIQSATLLFDDRGGELKVAYLLESKEHDPEPHQFLRANAWFKFNDGDLPRTLLFADNRGWVTMTDTRVTGISMGNFPLGQIRARALIFNRPRTIQPEYSVRDFMSTIDGLEAFARFAPITFDMQPKDGGGHRVELVVDAAESVSWTAGGFEYLVHANVSWTGQDGRSFEILDNRPYLQTTREGGATIYEHYRAQQPVRALLTLVHGTALSWRSHRLRDDEFPTWMLDGSDHGPSAVDVILEATVRQHRAEEPDSSAFVFSAFRLHDLGGDGLARWVDLYGDDDFRRAVEPAVEVINGATKFLEPQLMMLAISLDRFGYFRFGDGTRRAMHEHVQKCLEEAQLDWPEIGSRVGIAKAIANVNNDLKHPDRPEYPETDELAGITRLAEVIARTQLFDLLGLDPKLRTDFLASNDVRHAVQSFTAVGITVNEDGTFNHADRQPMEGPVDGA